MSVRYKSTRGGQSDISFRDAVISGLATDGGLFVPETIPQISFDDINKMRGMSYVDMSYEILSKFVCSDQIPGTIILVGRLIFQFLQCLK
jgi:threonine synthase